MTLIKRWKKLIGRIYFNESEFKKFRAWAGIERRRKKEK